jgi:hypothetical protein
MLKDATLNQNELTRKLSKFFGIPRNENKYSHPKDVPHPIKILAMIVFLFIV